MHPSDFENRRFPLNACLLNRLLQTGEVQAKASLDNRTKGEMTRVKKQAFFYRIAGMHGSLERREVHKSKTLRL